MASFKELMAAKNRPSVEEEIKNVTANRDYEAIATKTKEKATSEEVIPPVKEKPTPVARSTKKTEKSTTSVAKPQKQGKIETTPKEAADKEKTTVPAPVFNRVYHLDDESNRFVRMQAKRQGYTHEKYFSHIIQQEMESPNRLDGEKLFLACYKKFNSGKERMNVSLTEEHLSFLSSQANNAGITIINYLLYIISLDMKKEQE